MLQFCIFLLFEYHHYYYIVYRNEISTTAVGAVNKYNSAHAVWEIILINTTKKCVCEGKF